MSDGVEQQHTSEVSENIEIRKSLTQLLHILETITQEPENKTQLMARLANCFSDPELNKMFSSIFSADNINDPEEMQKITTFFQEKCGELAKDIKALLKKEEKQLGKIELDIRKRHFMQQVQQCYDKYAWNGRAVTVAGDEFVIKKRIAKGGNGAIYQAIPMYNGKSLRDKFSCVLKTPSDHEMMEIRSLALTEDETDKQYFRETLSTIETAAKKQADILGKKYEVVTAQGQDPDGNITVFTLMPLLKGEPIATETNYPINLSANDTADLLTTDTAHQASYTVSTQLQSLTLSERLSLASVFMEKLKKLHDMGQYHTDISPGNILINITRDKNGVAHFEVNLIDFADRASTPMITPPEGRPIEIQDDIIERRADNYGASCILAIILQGDDVCDDKAVGDAIDAESVAFNFDGNMSRYLADQQDHFNISEDVIALVKMTIKKMGDQNAENRLIDDSAIIATFANAAKTCQELENKSNNNKIQTPIDNSQDYVRLAHVEYQENKKARKQLMRMVTQLRETIENISNNIDTDRLIALCKSSYAPYNFAHNQKVQDALLNFKNICVIQMQKIQELINNDKNLTMNDVKQSQNDFTKKQGDFYRNSNENKPIVKKVILFFYDKLTALVSSKNKNIFFSDNRAKNTFWGNVGDNTVRAKNVKNSHRPSFFKAEEENATEKSSKQPDSATVHPGMGKNSR